MRNHAHGSNDGIIPNGDTFQNHSPTAEPHIVSNLHWANRPDTAIASRRVDFVKVAIVDCYLVADLTTVANGDRTGGYDRYIVTERVLISNSDPRFHGSRLQKNVIVLSLSASVGEFAGVF